MPFKKGKGFFPFPFISRDRTRSCTQHKEVRRIFFSACCTKTASVFLINLLTFSHPTNSKTCECARHSACVARDPLVLKLDSAFSDPSAVGVLPGVSLCYLNTMSLCLSEPAPRAKIHFEGGRRLFRDTHSMPSADTTLRFYDWKIRDAANESLSYLEKRSDTSELRRKEGREKRGEERAEKVEKRGNEINKRTAQSRGKQLCETLHSAERVREN